MFASSATTVTTNSSPLVPAGTAYIKELDAVRGLAILSVLVAHWFPTDTLWYEGAEIINAPNFFFTISGFLITKILLGDRARAEAGGFGKTVIFKNFFAKRALRIFPPYYLLLAVVYLLNQSEPINYTPYLTFTSNFAIYNAKVWGQLTHLWSMAVEEQFYFFWPLLILLLPRKSLPYAIGFFALIGVFSQRFLPNTEFSPILTFTCFDALAVGALLSWLLFTFPQHTARIYKVLSGLAIFSLVLFITNQLTPQFYLFSNRTLTSIMICWLLLHFSYKPNGAGPLAFVFHNKALIAIGKMSYGIYLYHSPLPFYAYRLYQFIYSLVPVPEMIRKNPHVYIAQNLLLVLLLSWLSWRFFEQPLLRLKTKFRLPRPAQPPVPQAADAFPNPPVPHAANPSGMGF